MKHVLDWTLDQFLCNKGLTCGFTQVFQNVLILLLDWFVGYGVLPQIKHVLDWTLDQFLCDKGLTCGFIQVFQNVQNLLPDWFVEYGVLPQIKHVLDWTLDQFLCAMGLTWGFGGLVANEIQVSQNVLILFLDCSVFFNLQIPSRYFQSICTILYKDTQHRDYHKTQYYLYTLI